MGNVSLFHLSALEQRKFLGEFDGGLRFTFYLLCCFVERAVDKEKEISIIKIRPVITNTGRISYR